MMERHSKKELTRLILTALILAGGSLYMPAAEAVTIESTDTQTTLEGKGFAVGTYNDVPLIGYQTNGTELTINGVPADYTGYNMVGFYTNTTAQVKNNNKVIVCGGTMKGVYGAYGAAGTTTNNTVEINATTNDITITGAIVGAGSGRMTAQYVSGNTVTISGNSSKLHLADAIVYGAIGHGDEFVQDNTVNINTGVTLKGIIGATEYAGGYYSHPNGNVLNLGATGITVTGTGTVEGVQGFETIKIGYTDTNSQFHNVSFADGGTVLSVTGNVLYTNATYGTGTITLDISGATGLTGETSKVGTMTLISASNSLANMKLKYSSADAAVIPTTGVKVNSDTSTHYSTANHIKFDYTYDHTVKLANSNTSIQYNIANNVAKVTPDGSIDWNNGGTVRALTDTTYTFGSGTAIDMSNLTFTSTAVDHNPLGESMTLLSGATGITGGSITQPGDGKGTIAANFTDTAGINFVGTAKGTVSVGTGTNAGKVLYTLNSGTLNNINLGSWNGTASSIPTNWTGTNVAVATGNFASEPTANVDIFTTTTENFFNDTYITGAKKYSGGTELVDDTAKGVTLTGYKGGGVKATDSGKKLSYFKEMMDTQSITLGQMTWGQGRTAASGYNFANIGNGEIDATNLTFTNPTAATGSMDLLSGATDLQAGLTVVGASHSQNFTGSAAANGATFDGTINGTVATAAEKITYTVGTKNITGIDLAGWDGTSTALDGWTANLGANSIKAEGFTAPTLTAGTETNIFTTSAANFFSDTNITGAQKYGASTAPSSDTDAGVTFTGNQQKGVKASTDGKNLVYAVGNMAVSNIALGNMTWGTGRAITGNYDFSTVANNGVDASGLNFNFTGDTVNTISSSTPVWNLVTDATGLNGSLTVKGSPVSQSISYDLDNVATLNGTLTGTVATAANTVTYTVTDKTLNSVDISKWNGTAATGTNLDASWEKNASGISVTGSGFTKPTTYGDHTILTATDANFFTGAKIDSSIAYTLSGNYSETEQNITLSGKQAGGVLANGSSLVYKVGTASIDTIKLGKVTYAKDTVLLNKSDTNLYNYSNVNSLDKSSFVMSMTDEQKKAAKANDSMTLVQANNTLNDIAAQEASKGSYTYANTSATSDLTVKGTVTGNVAAVSSNVIYTVASNTASALTINSVTWNSGTYARPDSEIAYSTALVNADNITFTGVDTLSKNDTMVLVSNYANDGDKVNKVRGGIFTLSNGKTGKGHAYYDSATHSLVYVVDRGVDDEVETKTAIGTKTIIINEQPHQGDVPGGEAEGDGEAKDNETIIKKSHIQKNPDGTGGDTNGGTSEDGDADKNKLDIEESEIDGDATGGQSDTGNTDDNETIIKKKSIIHGGVAGGETLGGHGGSRRNKTTVEESTVEGDVDGGKTGGDGETEENEVVITGSKIGGDVNGGHSGGDGDSSGNEVTVDNSTVDGDVNGGKSDGNGNTKNNKVDIRKGSKIGGSVHGGHSGGSGDSTGNEVTVDGSEVDGNVMGGRTKDGNANNNTVNIDGGSTINGSVYGGYSDTGDASGNNVNIGTGKINGDIYGGYSGGTGSTINNTVTLYGDADVSGSNIIGGSNGSTGNTLNIGKGTESWTGGGQTVKNVSNFDTLNFTALPWNSDTPALTIGDGSATDLSNTTVTAQQVAFTGVKTISVGSTMMFLDQSNVAAGKKATNINSGSDFTVGTAMEGTGKLVLDANGNVIYQVETAGASRQTHNTVMAAEAAVVALNAGNDFILSAREGLARKENIGKDGIAVFAKIGGGATRQETGSHVNVNMWNGIVAVGRKNVQKESTTEYGVFVEHGWGNFSTHSDNAHRGDGSVDYTGGGLLGKWTKADGLYVEGSLRIGSMHEKGNNLLRDTVRGYGYDERTTYKGFHLGVGKEFAIKDGNTVEVYGKYFYNRKDGMNFNAGLDEYNLDAVTSQILRVGARYTMKRERWNYYGDLSYEHELDGKAAGRANGMAIRGADTSGGSVRLELGAKLLANEKSPWTLDLNLTGYAGKKQGLQGGISVKYMF